MQFCFLLSYLANQHAFFSSYLMPFCAHKRTIYDVRVSMSMFRALRSVCYRIFGGGWAADLLHLWPLNMAQKKFCTKWHVDGKTSKNEQKHLFMKKIIIIILWKYLQKKAPEVRASFDFSSRTSSKNFVVFRRSEVHVFFSTLFLTLKPSYHFLITLDF